MVAVSVGVILGLCTRLENRQDQNKKFELVNVDANLVETGIGVSDQASLQYFSRRRAAPAGGDFAQRLSGAYRQTIEAPAFAKTTNQANRIDCASIK